MRVSTLTILILLSTAAFNVQVFAATYEISFRGTWSPNDVEPGTYPNSAHFSTIIGTTHQADSEFWRNGGSASQGVEDVAELGINIALETEISNLRQAGKAGNTVTLDSQFALPQTSTTRIQVDDDKTFLSLITMIAPSPDWFVGVSALALQENGQWRENIRVELRPYDAGTEEGTDFSLGNPATNGGRISRLGQGESPFLGQPVIATLNVRLIEPLPPTNPPETPPTVPPIEPPTDGKAFVLSSIINLLLND